MVTVKLGQALAAAAAATLAMCCSPAAAAGSEAGAVQAAELLAQADNDAAFLSTLRDHELLQGQPRACEGGVDGSLLGSAMQRGFFDSVLELIRTCAERGVKVDTGVHQSANSMRRRISEVTALLQNTNAAQTVVAPAFEWAQSGDSVFVGVKFAHKLDAPACIDVVDENVEIKKQVVKLQATCKGKNKRFSLELELLEAIDPSQSSWAMASVGRGTLTLVKADAPAKWERLLKSSSDKPRNMHTWWQLHEKYAAELDKLEADAEAAAKAEQGSADDAAVPPAEEAASEAAGKVEQVSAEEAQREAERKELKKRAKLDSKKVVKEAKKAAKAVDAALKTKLKDIDDKAGKEKKAEEDIAKAERERILADKKEKLARIESTLQEAMTKLENGPEAEAGSGGILGLYERMSSLLFGGGAEAAGDDAQEADEPPALDDARTDL